MMEELTFRLVVAIGLGCGLAALTLTILRKKQFIEDDSALVVAGLIGFMVGILAFMYIQQALIGCAVCVAIFCFVMFAPRFGEAIKALVEIVFGQPPRVIPALKDQVICLQVVGGDLDQRCVPRPKQLDP